MIRSMTGYSSHREQIGEANVSIEIKTLNHKSFDFHYHSSRAFSMLEILIREELQKVIQRGRIEVFLRTNRSLISSDSIQPNLELAEQYLAAAQKLSNHLQLPFSIRLDNIMNYNGVLDTEEKDNQPDECWVLVKSLIDKAIQDTISMKKNEGLRLKEELMSQLLLLKQADEKINSFRDQIIQEYRQKLLERIKEWQETVDMDENRILQEIAFHCDRSDVQEETVRLKSHIEQFIEIINENKEQASYKAVGRRLDFLCQEMFREVNTIGSKSSSLEIVRLVLEMKGIIEQVREQVQNVE